MCGSQLSATIKYRDNQFIKRKRLVCLTALEVSDPGQWASLFGAGGQTSRLMYRMKWNCSPPFLDLRGEEELWAHGPSEGVLPRGPPLRLSAATLKHQLGTRPLSGH